MSTIQPMSYLKLIRPLLWFRSLRVVSLCCNSFTSCAQNYTEILNRMRRYYKVLNTCHDINVWNKISIIQYNFVLKLINVFFCIFLYLFIFIKHRKNFMTNFSPKLNINYCSLLFTLTNHTRYIDTSRLQHDTPKTKNETHQPNQVETNSFSYKLENLDF